METKRSLILSSRDKWTGRIEIKVGLSAAKVFAFYQQNLPNFRWIPVMSVQSDISVMAFTREDRAGAAQLQSQTLRGSRVTVTIAPRQADAPATVRPVR